MAGRDSYPILQTTRYHLLQPGKICSYTYNIHLPYTLTICTYNIHLQYTLKICTYNLHLQYTLTIYTYNIHLQYTLTICTYNTHLQYTLTIYACTKSLYTVNRLAMKYWLFYKKTLFSWQWSTGYFIKNIIWLAMKYWVFDKKHCSVGNEVLGIL